MAVEQFAVVAPQVHAAALAVSEHRAIGAFAPARPFAVAERLEAVLPHVPEPIPVDVSLMVVGADRRAPRNGPVDTDRSHRNTRGALVEMVADLGLVTAQEAFAGIADLDPALLPRAADELQHLPELGVGHPQRRVVLGTPHRENREEPPVAHPLRKEHVAEGLQLRDHRPRDAGDHVVRQRGFTHDHPHGLQRAVVTAGIAADIVVFALETVEAHRNRFQPRVEQTAETFRGQGHAVGHHAPRVAAARDLGARLLQVRADEHLAAREDDQHVGGIDVGRHLLVEHLQKISQRHVRHAGVHPAVAAAMAAREVAAQRTFPEERIEPVLGDSRGVKVGKNIDYVAGWYFKASKFMANSLIKTAFVSTNSITQGEQVSAVWQPMYKFFNIHIDFAYRTFRWDSEANLKAHVHCVIIGFSCALNSSAKVLYTSDSRQLTDNINPYLLAGPTVFINRQSRPISDVPPIHRGSQPTDNGNFILTNEEKDELLQKEPQAAPFIRPYMMGKDFIVRHPRYCIWLVGANPTILKKCPQILQRVQKVRDFRLNSKKAATRIKANTPMLFDEIHDSSTDYVAIPKVSSERRRYIPMDYVSSDVISGDKLFMMPNASLYHFGVLNSNVHMAWMRAVGGRLKSDYSYSNTIVYNNFPWPTSTDQQREKIEQTARKILDARELYPDSSLADLYDPLTMPPELLKAHTENNKVVMAAYGFTTKMSEEDCVAELMKLYQKLIKAEKRR